MTHLERVILFLAYYYQWRIIYDDACHLKKCCVNNVQKNMTAVSKRLGEMDMVVEKLQFRNYVDLCNSHDRNELHGVNECLSVCPSVYRHHLAFFLGGGVGGLTCDCEGNRLNSNNGSMWWP